MVQTSCSCAPLAVAPPPVVQTSSSCAPQAVTLPAPLAVAPPPVVQTSSSCAPQAVTLPPVVQTSSSCAPLAVALPPVVQTSIALPSVAHGVLPTMVSPTETWSTVVRSRPKRPPGLIAAVKPPPSKAKKPVIGTARATGIAAVDKRKRRANIFASRFAPDQCPVALKRYLDSALQTSVTCTKLDTKHPDEYSSFLVVADVDNPRSLLDLTDLTRLPTKQELRWLRTRKPLAYRESTCTNLSVSCPYEIIVYSVLKHINTARMHTSSRQFIPLIYRSLGKRILSKIQPILPFH